MAAARWSRIVARAAVVAAVVIGVALRLWPRSALWLDEAQSVAIASAPFRSVPDTLRIDGAPPLYYLALHVWMELFGSGDAAVRSLSVVLSLIALGLLGLAVARVSDRRAAAIAVVIGATNPFAIRYASEARMYALVTVEVLAGFLFLHAALRSSRASVLAGLAVTTAALLYTHYWAMYLTVSALSLLAWRALRAQDERRRRTARSAVVAMLVGVALWLPWLPTLAFQSQHTATPWTQAPTLRTLSRLLDLGTSGDGSLRRILGVALFALLLVAVVAGRRARAVAPIAPTAVGGIVVLTVVVAIAGASISGSAYSPRYTSVVFPLLLVAASLGVVSLPRRAQAPLVAIVALVGAALAVEEVGADRTTAVVTVPALAAEARDGDVLVYCPDQLGPAASRLVRQEVGPQIVERVFPPGSTPERVDWIDYRERYDAADASAFVAEITAAAPSATIWLIWSATYPATQRACIDLFDALSRRRPRARPVVPDDPTISDHGGLWRFDLARPATAATP